MRYDFEDPEFNDANEELYDIDFFDDLEGDDDAYGRAEDFYGLPPYYEEEDYYDFPINWEEDI